MSLFNHHTLVLVLANRLNDAILRETAIAALTKHDFTHITQQPLEIEG